MVFYLVYLSSATRQLSDIDLSQILTKSRFNNTSRNITGLLLYNGGNILQILEGDEEKVMNLYEHIEKDERHNGLIKTVSGFCDERNFPDWSMGFKTVSAVEWSELAGYLKMNSSNILGKLKQSNKYIGTMVNSYMKVSGG